MKDELRPCAVVFKEIHPWSYERGLFHRWCEPQQRVSTADKKTKLVALVELQTGSITEVKPDDMWFLDTAKQMDKFTELKGFESVVAKTLEEAEQRMNDELKEPF